MDFTDEEYLILDRVAKDINNIQLLDEIPKKKLESLKQYLSNHCNSYVFRNYMKNGIITFDLDLPLMSYVKLYNKKYNVIIYVFGETHVSENNCKTSFESLLSNLDKVPYLVDIFTEVGRYDIRDNITRMSKNMQSILKFHIISKDMVNVRTHESDVRMLDTITGFREEIAQLGGVKDFNQKDLKEIPPLPKILIDRIYKQISKVYDSKYKRFLKSHFDKTVKEFNLLRKEVSKLWNKKIREFSPESKKIMNMATLFDEKGNLSIMDSYVLARIHRTYREIDNDKRNCSVVPKNIMYVCGNDHVKLVKNLLTEHMDYIVLKESKEDKNCVNIGKESFFERPI